MSKKYPLQKARELYHLIEQAQEQFPDEKHNIAVDLIREFQEQIQLDAAKSALELAVKKIKFTIDNNDMRQSILTLANDPQPT